MFARLSYLHGTPAAIDDLIAFTEQEVKPATDRLIGNLGLGMWVNRSTGDALVATAWADDATMRASEPAVTSFRTDAAAVMRGVASVERYQIVHVDTVQPNLVGDVLRVVRMHCDPAALDTHVAWSRQVLPALRSIPGYRSYVVATDRHSGAVLGLSTYSDGIAADVAFAATAPQRTAAVNRGISIEAVTTYEVAIVGIRPPLPQPAAGSAPRQRAIQLPAEAPV